VDVGLAQTLVVSTACIAVGVMYLLVDEEGLPEPFARFAKWVGRTRAAVICIVVGLTNVTVELAEWFGWV
jgi:hypothetical protein